MCATLCALTIPLLLCSGSHPARAGSWTYSVTSDDKGTTYTDNGVTQTLPPFAGSSYAITRDGGGASGIGCSISITVHVQGTYTWVPAKGQTLKTDPPPPNVMVVESSTATGSANVNTDRDGNVYGTFDSDAADALSDQKVVTSTSTSKTSTSASPTNEGYLLTGEHFKSYPASSGVIALPSYTMTASATATYPADHQWYYGASASVSYSAAIHAQPYNFRRTYFSNETPPTSVIRTAGELQFHYSWSSTSGNQANLSGIEIHENVDAPSSPSVTINGVTGYAPPPPFGWSPPFHFDSVAVDAASTAGIVDDHTWGNGSAPITDCFATPYKAGSFVLTQTYKYHDPATMTSGVEQVIPGASGPLSITFAVVVDPNSPTGFSFVVTKSGTPSLPQPLP